MVEIWKDIKGYDGLYQISNFGNVRSVSILTKYGSYVDRKEPRILSQETDKDGYKRVVLVSKRKHKKFFVHRLVLLAFIGNEKNLPCVNHKDENPANNHLSNLEWCTVEYNNRYGHCIERRKKAMINHYSNSKKVAQYSLNGELVAEYPSTAEAERRTGYSSASIQRCCNGKQMIYKNFKWLYC